MFFCSQIIPTGWHQGVLGLVRQDGKDVGPRLEPDDDGGTARRARQDGPLREGAQLHRSDDHQLGQDHQGLYLRIYYL